MLAAAAAPAASARSRWMALKVGALSYGGGFVIIPLMQADAVDHHHWMTDGQFLNAVALGQITPGPVVQTVAVVGYAAAGVGGGLLAALIAFAPSFAFVLVGAGGFDALLRRRARAARSSTARRRRRSARSSARAVPLAAALEEPWQWALLAAAAVALLVARRGVLATLLAAGAAGAVAALSGAPLPR